MRILLLTPMPPDVSGTGAIPVLLAAQLEGLVERHEVTLATVAGPEPQELEAVRRLGALGVDAHAIERRPLTGRPRWARRRRLAGAWLRGAWPWRTVWFWQPRLQQVVDRLGAERSFDLVLAEDNAMGIYRLPTTALRVLTEYEVRRPRAVSTPPHAPRQWPGWGLAEADWIRWPRYQRETWRRFDAIQVFTERDAATLAEIAPDLAPRVHVNPFPISLPALDGTRPEPDTIAFLGNYTHRPNVDAALWLGREIMPRLRGLRPQARLVLVGAHAPEAVRALEAPDIRVLGWVADAEALMRSTAVIVAPVRIGGGMRMKVLHAMALARPVVTTPRGADGLVTAGDPLPLAVSEDADGIARLSAELLADPDARRELGAAARRHVERHHAPAAYVARLETLYAEARDRGVRHDRPGDPT
jgi:glycosyltransferase involved in cell wall biosynthesis